MNILFITSSRIGDAVLSTSLLAHLLERYHECRLTIACGAAAAPLFEAVPNLERLISLEKRRYSAHWISLWSRCAHQRWDLVVDLRGSGVSYLLIARDRRVKRPSRGPGHTVEHLAKVLDLSEPANPRIWTHPDHWTAAESLLPTGAPVLGVGPVANWRGKQWPAARFIELIDRLTGPDGILPNARVATFGAASERLQAEAVSASVSPGRRVDLVGKADLPTAYLCLRQCAFYVGNDSGTMHLAAAAGVPTLGLFGPSREELYRPWGERTAVVRTAESYDELIGAPDYDYRTTSSLMHGLSVDAAEAAARALWARCDEAAV